MIDPSCDAEHSVFPNAHVATPPTQSLWPASAQSGAPPSTKLEHTLCADALLLLRGVALDGLHVVPAALLAALPRDVEDENPEA